MPIYILNEQKAMVIKAPALRRQLNKILKELDLSQAELSILITHDEKMRQINQEHRGLDKTTNVLAFALEDDFSSSNEQGLPRILGDIVISTETILREASELGYTPAEMFYFYLIHGLLHLIGYDHELSPAEAMRQENETERLWGTIEHSL
ncbi:MAG: rRNA maturation RNase YbeY [Candidatus Adiutrix sp.]